MPTGGVAFVAGSGETPEAEGAVSGGTVVTGVVLVTEFWGEGVNVISDGTPDFPDTLKPYRRN